MTSSRTGMRWPAFLFMLGLALLFCHEIDAALHAEWRLLWVLRDLSDGLASKWFVWLHLPVFLAALYLGQASNRGIRLAFRRMVCVFLPVHAILHFSLSQQVEYQFHHLTSSLLIYGAGLCGITYCLLWWLGIGEQQA
ncbi:MAG: DUF6713 family protein [bacterium]